jgi:hypothetical protein
LAQRVVEQFVVASPDVKGLALVEPNGLLWQIVIADHIADLAEGHLLQLFVPPGSVLRGIHGQLAEHAFQMGLIP